MGIRAVVILLSCLAFHAQAATLSVCQEENTRAKTLASPLIENTRIHLQVEDIGPAGGCDNLSLPLAGSAIRWGRIIRPALLADEDVTVILQGRFTAGQASVSEIILPESEIPESAGDTITPELRPPSANPVSYRSGWLWQPSWWLAAGEQTWELAGQAGLDRLYITVDIADGAIAEPQRLAEFLAAAHSRGLAVWAVVGDRRDVLPGSQAMLQERAAAYMAYNDARPEREHLDGLQLDIEPYLLQGFNLDQDLWRDRYIATVTAVHELLDGAMPLDLAMPVWWGVHAQWGERLFNALGLPGLGVTVMNYRTDIDRLRSEALPFLRWGEQSGVAVHMALEYGPLMDETRLHFYPGQQSGELWQFRVGEYEVLVLLDSEQTGLPGRSWKKAFESEFSAANLTFSGNRDALFNAARVLARDWSAWSSFAGIAIHGVDTLGE